MKAPISMNIYGKLVEEGHMIRLRSIPWVRDEGGEKILKFLEEKVNKNSVILEFGSGGSTIWFAKNGKSVVAFEQDPLWHRIVTTSLSSRRIKNATVYFLPNYPERIWRLLKKNTYDLVLNDGQNRPKCCAMVMAAVKPSGYIVTSDGPNVPSRRQAKMLSDAGWRYVPILEDCRAAWRKPKR